MSKTETRSTLDSIDFDNDDEMDALLEQVLAEGDKVYAAQRAESIRLGIIDEDGRLLKTELPEDMREGPARTSADELPLNPIMTVVAGPPGSGKSSRFPVAGYGADWFNADDRAAE